MEVQLETNLIIGTIIAIIIKIIGGFMYLFHRINMMRDRTLSEIREVEKECIKRRELDTVIQPLASKVDDLHEDFRHFLKVFLERDNGTKK